MSRRAAAADATRDRIIEATVALYRTQGVAATTMVQVAERADVARATVLNHFGDADGLTAAAMESIAESLQLPTAGIFEGATDRSDKLRRLTAALYDLYDRSGPWFSVLQTDISSVPAMRRREQQFWKDMQALYRAALGPLSRNRKLLATVAALTGPATCGALRDAGLSTAEAARVVGDLLATAVASRNQ